MRYLLKQVRWLAFVCFKMNPNEQPGEGDERTPGNRGDSADEEPGLAGPGVQLGGETTEPFAPPAAVLVIDDEAPIRWIAVRILQSAGYVVMEAAGGAEALEIVSRAERPFDAVLLDLSMPGMDGAQVLRALLDLDSELRVLLMSGYGEQDTLARFTDQKVAGFVPKPFSAQLLIKKVGQVLAAGRRG